MTKHPAKAALAATVLASLALSACSVSTNEPTPPAAPASPTGSATGSAAGGKACADGGTVTLVTHDSFVVPDELLTRFTQTSGCTLSVVKSGDAGALANKLVLTKGSPLGDVVFGVDNTFASRVVKEGTLAAYTPAALPSSAGKHALAGDGKDQLTPVDFGDVCVNVDKKWFEQAQIAPPKTLDDLTKPAFKSLFVTPSASTSSPGMAFFLATVGAKGKDGWQQYWKDLKANDVKVARGWTEAYNVDFSAGEGKGARPIVLSYASSPAYTVPKGGTETTTAALLDTCFRQVEYAGVIKGAKNEAGARAFVDFLVSKDVQASIPENMYVYPVDAEVKLPADWAKHAAVAPNPLFVAPDDIDAGRDAWLKQWTEITTQ